MHAEGLNIKDCCIVVADILQCVTFKRFVENIIQLKLRTPVSKIFGVKN